MGHGSKYQHRMYSLLKDALVWQKQILLEVEPVPSGGLAMPHGVHTHSPMYLDLNYISET